MKKDYGNRMRLTSLSFMGLAILCTYLNFITLAVFSVFLSLVTVDEGE